MILIFRKIYKKIKFFLIKSNKNVFINIKLNIIITLYVNNILIIDFNKFDIQCIKNNLNVKFYISNLKLYIYYFDIIVKKNYRVKIIYLN